MCGIAGIWEHHSPSLVARMLKHLNHRGPDDQGSVTLDGPAAELGHCRLSIMDVQGGHQPLKNAAGTRFLVANGEIYNHPALRRQLEQRHRFSTGSDSESALHLYGEAGTDTAAQLDGMFALAIVDHQDLYLARDPIGIKPLYFGHRNGKLVFASELKALAGLAEDVREFPPGTWYHSQHGFQQYYELPDTQPVERPLAEQLHQIRETLERAIVKRLMSDVPVGAFLSGGLDSSVIAAIARQHVDQLHTFSVGIEGSRDLLAARQVARHIDSIHHEYIFSVEEVLAELPKIIHALESFDQDLVRSAVPCHFTSRLAAEHVKVILTGEGADELFAGYDYYKEIETPEALHQELRRSVGSLHNINLQRVDRLTMAHSLEGRVPFLDLDLIELAATIPPQLKLLRQADGQQVEKWILRKACEDLLPAEIVWRDKEQFDQGSGAADMLPAAMAELMSVAEAEQYKIQHPESELRSPEECMYHKLLLDAYPQPKQILANVGRWSFRETAAT